MSKVILEMDEDNLGEIEANLKVIQDLIEKAKQPEKWEGPKGEWIVEGDGNVVRYDRHGGVVPRYMKTGHCGETKEQAEYIRDQLTHYARMLHAWREVVGDWRPDWSDDSLDKIYAWVDHRNNQFCTSTVGGVSYAHGFYFETEEQAHQFIEMVGDRIKELGQ